MPIQVAQILSSGSKQVDACLEYRQPWLDNIKKSEDAYFGKTKPALKGRFNVPLPIVEGFTETLMSKIKDEIKVVFKRGREATLKAAKKVSSAYEKDSAPDRGNFNEASSDADKLAIFSGIAPMKLSAQSNPYLQTLEAVDYYDLIFEPHGGRDIDKHLFKGQLNIFKTKGELIDGAELGIYDKGQVREYLKKCGVSDTKSFQGDAYEKYQRFASMKLNPGNYNFVGTPVFNLTELITRVDDQEYYLLFDKKNDFWLRCQPVDEVFPGGFSPFMVWHTERNPFSFLSKAPLDGVRPVYESMRILLSQNFDNIQHRNWDQVLYNAKKIINPSQLEYRPNGLITVRLKEGESMDNAYRKMETPDTSSITINLLQWLDNFMGQKSGVSPGSQGMAAEDKVGIYYGNMQQMADRFSLLNDFKTEVYNKLGQRYKANLGKFMPPRKFMVHLAGAEEALTKDEVNEELSVSVVSSSAETKNSLLNAQKRTGAIDRIISTPVLLSQVKNPRFLLDEVMRTGEFNEDEIKMLSEEGAGYNAILMSEAAKAIEDILDGKKPALNQGANLAFVRKIKDFVTNNSDDMTDRESAALLTYAAQHLEIASKNELEEKMFAMKAAMQNQVLPPGMPGSGQPGQPIINKPAGQPMMALAGQPTL